MTGLGQIVKQYELAGLCVQRARGNGHTATVLERDFMTIIFARREATTDHVAPEYAQQGLPQQVPGGWVGLTHNPGAVDDDDAARQQIQQVLQAIRQALFLCQLLHPLGTDHRQFALELGHSRLQQTVGVRQLRRHLVEQVELLFKPMSACLFYGQLYGVWQVRGHLGGLRHKSALAWRTVSKRYVACDLAIPVPKKNP